jgi:hypothetical protein
MDEEDSEQVKDEESELVGVVVVWTIIGITLILAFLAGYFNWGAVR